MAKIDIEKLRHILHRNESDIKKINDILNDIAMELQIEQAEKEARPPAVKKQFITLIADNDGHLLNQDFASWVLQIPEEATGITEQEHRGSGIPKRAALKTE